MSPYPTTYKIQSHVSILRPEARVAELIDADTRWWNTSLIHHIFCPAEATSCICSLALSPGGQPDKLIWIGNSNGVFSTRIAYHLENERIVREKGESSMASTDSEVWRKVWKLRVPGVVRTFL